jgi:trehalose 6-phosphate synthase
MATRMKRTGALADRLIVVSNRIPTDEVPSGGLVVAMHEALRETGGLWIGAHPEPADEPTDTLERLPAQGYEKRAFRLTEAERQSYYLGYANSVLWPLCHRRVDLIALEPDYAEGYLAVNARVARQIAEIAGPEDMIWVQDYHFFPLAAELRRLGCRARMGLFLHIPFPVASDIAALPEQDNFPYWLSAYDLLGLQTRADVARCLELFRSLPDAEMFIDGKVKHGARLFSVAAFPIGIDARVIEEAAQQGGGRDLVKLAPDEDLLIGVDRLDYSKGLPNRLRAFGHVLENHEIGQRRPHLIQIAPPSRGDVPAYQRIRAELDSIASEVNGRHADLGWTPIQYLNRSYPRETLARLFRAARVGLVTPLADGMNLVAKEYVAAQDPEDPGVLVLSRTAGAAEQLTEALLVNPFDVDDIARAIETALVMPLEGNVEAWRTDFLRALRAAEPQFMVG